MQPDLLSNAIITAGILVLSALAVKGIIDLKIQKSLAVLASAKVDQIVESAHEIIDSTFEQLKKVQEEQNKQTEERNKQWAIEQEFKEKELERLAALAEKKMDKHYGKDKEDHRIEYTA